MALLVTIKAPWVSFTDDCDSGTAGMSDIASHTISHRFQFLLDDFPFILLCVSDLA